MTEAAVVIVVLLIVVWGVARFHLRGPDLSAFDQPTGQHFGADSGGDEQRAVLAALGRIVAPVRSAPHLERNAALRRAMDEAFPVDDPAVTFTAVDADGVPAEWVLTPGADPTRRVLYIHGGAFIAGSPKSHRRLTSKFAEIIGGVVLAIDYRLMPEHRRIEGVEDCRTAYRWLLDNGPHGRAAAARLWVAGDSAGGNLALSLIAWVRDSGLRAPDAAVALSPLTDATLSSPSLSTNVATDPMLGPVFGPLTRFPHALLLWMAWIRTRINPSDPVISPARGDLSRLPPVLVQASESEMLRDDARRYVNRARAAGSPVQLQTWDHMVHVWQIFHPELAAGRQALDEIRRFLSST